MHSLTLTTLTAVLLAGAGATQEPVRPATPAQPAVKLTAPLPPGPPPNQDDLKHKRAEKLAKPVFKHAAWLTDYDAARAQAKQTGKLILVYFTRSYAH